MNLTLTQYITGVNKGSYKPEEILQSYVEKASNDTLTNSFARIDNDYIAKNATGFYDLPLKGAPIGVKDNFLCKDTISSCGSNILSNYRASYTSTAIRNLELLGGCMIGKTNMDEFAMGSSTQTCALGAVKNPYDLSRIPGGSSGGSAAAVAADLCIAALGSDTAGSVRQPAAMCGLVGVKPTYGRVSRYGIQAMSSSLDQAGVISKTVDDAVILLDAISGYDPNDAMTIDRKNETTSRGDALNKTNITGRKLALPKQFLVDGLDSRIRDKLMNTIESLKNSGAIIEEVDMPIIAYGVPTYYILAPAEVSANMSRFDGIRYGLQHSTQDFQSLDSYYASIRQEGFGPEVLRRIMVGGYVLSAGFYDAYYAKAQRVRAKLAHQVNSVLKQYDAIIGPTSPVLPWKLGELMDDPTQMYLADIYTVIANLVGIPGISVPMGDVDESGVSLPTGFQIMTSHWDEKTLFEIAKVVESF